jgi:hypothetical protein
MKNYGNLALMEIVTSSSLYQQLEKKLRISKTNVSTQMSESRNEIGV